MKQGNLFTGAEQMALAPQPDDATAPDLHSYDRIILCTSGGKDSVAAFLRLVRLGVDPRRIELHHHRIDGAEGSRLFDWPCSEAYVVRFAGEFGSPLSYSWRRGGLEAEMMRDDEAAHPVAMQDAAGTVTEAGGNGPRRTVRKFPAPSSIANGRWCSASGKKDPFARFLANMPGFDGQRTLVVTGERAEEGPARALLPPFRPHPCDRRRSPKLRRHIDHWLPVHAWSRQKVWSVIREEGIVPHPCYYLGLGRTSCAFCIFAPNAQLALLAQADPNRFSEHEALERAFGHTVRHRTTLGQSAARGRSPAAATPERIAAAFSGAYDGPIRVAVSAWEEPAGAFADEAGPT